MYVERCHPLSDAYAADDGLTCEVVSAFEPLLTGDPHKILVVGIKHPEFEGLRITPNVYTALFEVDTFAAAIEELLERGLDA